MKEIKIIIYNKYGSNNNYFILNVEKDDSVNSIKKRIYDKMRKKARLYPKEKDKVLTGYCYYGLSGNSNFIIENYGNYKEFVIMKMI